MQRCQICKTSEHCKIADPLDDFKIGKIFFEALHNTLYKFLCKEIIAYFAGSQNLLLLGGKEEVTLC
jgi:hypothetical protein